MVPCLPWVSVGRGPSPRSSSGSVSSRPVSRLQSLQQTPSPNTVQMGHQKSYNIFFPSSHSRFLLESWPRCAALFLSLSLLSVSLSLHLFVSVSLSFRLCAVSPCLSPLSLCLPLHVYFSVPLPLAVPSCLACCLHLSVSLTSTASVSQQSPLSAFISGLHTYFCISPVHPGPSRIILQGEQAARCPMEMPRPWASQVSLHYALSPGLGGGQGGQCGFQDTDFQTPGSQGQEETWNQGTVKSCPGICWKQKSPP